MWIGQTCDEMKHLISILWWDSYGIAVTWLLDLSQEHFSVGVISSEISKTSSFENS